MKDLVEDIVIDITTKKVLNVGYWWPMLFHDVFELCKSCDACQRTGGLVIKSLAKLVTTLIEEPFMKWKLDFVGPINLQDGLHVTTTFLLSHIMPLNG